MSHFTEWYSSPPALSFYFIFCIVHEQPTLIVFHSPTFSVKCCPYCLMPLLSDRQFSCYSVWICVLMMTESSEELLRRHEASQVLWLLDWHNLSSEWPRHHSNKYTLYRGCSLFHLSIYSRVLPVIDMLTVISHSTGVQEKTSCYPPW